MGISGEVLVKFFVGLGVQRLFILLGELLLDVLEGDQLEGIDTLLEISAELKGVSGFFERLADVLFYDAPF